MTSAPLNIVLTNDDGFNAPGIQTLYTALVGAGFNVHIVAPQVNQSAQGSSLGGTAALNNPIDITQFSPGNFFVDGKPATATLTALDDLFAGQAPDLVISGTNRGDNIGESENISGTVNAALQGLFEGIPSIAISAGSFNGSFDAAFANAGAFMVNFLQELQVAHAPGSRCCRPAKGLRSTFPAIRRWPASPSRPSRPNRPLRSPTPPTACRTPSPRASCPIRRRRAARLRKARSS